MEPLLIDMMVAEHARELRTGARRDHLARIAACCRPSTWARWARSGRQALARVAARRSASAAVCCA